MLFTTKSQQIIELVAEFWDKPRLLNRSLNALGVEVVISTGGADDILLDHYRAEVVGAAMECQLCGLLTDGEP